MYTIFIKTPDLNDFGMASPIVFLAHVTCYIHTHTHTHANAHTYIHTVRFFFWDPQHDQLLFYTCITYHAPSVCVHH
jgi:hypothetical protein